MLPDARWTEKFRLVQPVNVKVAIFFVGVPLSTTQTTHGNRDSVMETRTTTIRTTTNGFVVSGNLQDAYCAGDCRRGSPSAFCNMRNACQHA